jgi:hypothetical protein
MFNIIKWLFGKNKITIINIGDNNFIPDKFDLLKFREELDDNSNIIVGTKISVNQIGKTTVFCLGDNDFRPDKKDVKNFETLLKGMGIKNFIVTNFPVSVGEVNVDR